MVEDDCFYWAKRNQDGAWEASLSVVYSDGEIVFYFPGFDWPERAFKVGPKIERYLGNDDD